MPTFTTCFSSPLPYGNSELKEVILSKDWSDTSLGSSDNWSESLLNGLQLIFYSNDASAVVWRKDQHLFFNAAFSKLFHLDRSLLGQKPGDNLIQAIKKGTDALNTVKATSKEVNANATQFVVNGKTYLFTFTPIGFTNDGFLISCKELLPASIEELKKQQDRFNRTASKAPVCIAILNGPEFNFEMVNKAYLQLVDKTEEELLGKDLFKCLPEVENVVKPLLQNVLKTGMSYHASELEVKLKRFGKHENAYFNLIYEPIKEADGSINSIMVVAYEITAQVNTKYLISQSEKQLRKVIMESPIAMTIFRGKEWIIEMANDTMFKQIWRKEEDQVIGKKLLDVFPELKQQEFPLLLEQVVSSKKTHRQNEAVAFVNGNDGMKKFYLDFEYAPLFDTDENVSGIMVTVYDVTEKVESRQKIKESADRLQMATEGTMLATWDLNLITREIFHTAQLAEIFGHSKEHQLTHEQMREQVHPDDRKNIIEVAFEKALETGLYNYEARVIHPDNSIRWIRTAGKVYYDDQHKPSRMLGTMMDITNEKAQEEKLARLAAIVESTSDAIIGKNVDGIITSWNDSAERIFGYTEKEAIGTPLKQLIPEDLLNQQDEIFTKIKNGEHIEHLETRRIHKSGRVLDVSLSYSPIRDINGTIISISKIARDISKQKQIERLVSDNEERLKILVEASELGTWDLDLIKQKLEYSARYLEILGFPPDVLPTHEEFLQRMHPDDLKKREQAIEQAKKTGVLSYTSRLIWGDGSIHWIEAKGKVFYNEQGIPFKMIGTARDLTEEKNRQQHLEESELRLRTAAISSELGTWEYDPINATMRWDDASRKLFGIDSLTPVTLELFWSKMHPDDREASLAKMMDALNPEIANTYDTEYRTIGWPDGNVRWIHAKGKAFFNNKNEPFHFSGTILDITEKRLALEELKDSEQKFRLLADSMPQLIWTGDLNGNLNYFNQSVYNYSGFSPEEIATKGWLQIVHPDEREQNVVEWMESVKTGKDFLFEHRFKRFDGEYRWQLSRAIPQKDKNGKIQMWVGTSTDIHDQKTFAKDLENIVQERTKDLQQANHELARMNEELASFAYVSSHDLQEPLRKIQTFANRIIEKEALSESGKDYFARMQNAAQRMQLLIEDLLAYSRTSTTEKVFEKTDLNTILDDVQHDLEQVIKEKKATVSSEVLPVLTIIPFQFRQLFTNIISNALKFSKPDVEPYLEIKYETLAGSEVAVNESDKAKTYGHISISDNGIGFPSEYNARIFEVFQRLHGKHEYKGTGIGLAICKKIMENHNGWITAIGEPNIGATFHIYIPL